MSAGEKKIAVVLVVVLVGLIGAYFAIQPKASEMGGGPGAGAGAGSPANQVQELGSPGAKLQITALVPVAEGCHTATIQALKEAYQKHPKDIYLKIVEFKGPAGQQYKTQLGVTCATVAINGKYSFDLNGRTVTFQKAEGGTYQPADILAVIDQELKKLG